VLLALFSLIHGKKKEKKKKQQQARNAPRKKRKEARKGNEILYSASIRLTATRS
jgi:hypothetical protein